MRTVKAQISLRIRAAWSRPSLSATESLDSSECINGKQIPGWYFEHAQDYLYPHILRLLRDIFSLDAARLALFFYFSGEGSGLKWFSPNWYMSVQHWYPQRCWVGRYITFGWRYCSDICSYICLCYHWNNSDTNHNICSKGNCRTFPYHMGVLKQNSAFKHG